MNHNPHKKLQISCQDTLIFTCVVNCIKISLTLTFDLDWFVDLYELGDFMSHSINLLEKLNNFDLPGQLAWPQKKCVCRHFIVTFVN